MPFPFDLGRPVFEEEQERKEKQPFVVVPPRDCVGPQPRCRACVRPVEWWIGDRYDGGFWGFCVRCHGEEMGGLVPETMPGGAILEVFCYSDPHVYWGLWWWVGKDGVTIQESPRYIAATTGGSWFMSPPVRWLRRHPLLVSNLMLISTLLPWVIYRMWWLMR
jgi:hypothetical protein